MKLRRKRTLALIMVLCVGGGGSYVFYQHSGYRQAAATNGTSASETSQSANSGIDNNAASNAGRTRAQLQTLKTELRQTAKQQLQLAATYNHGKALFFQHDYAQAIQTENQVIGKDASYYKAYNVKGIALCFSGHYETGMQNINKALKLAPNYDYAHFNKALALELYAHYDAALQAYHETIPIARPDWKKWSYYGIAAIYGRRGDVKDTVRYLKLAIAMDPQRVKQVARTESDFDNVRQSPQFQNLVK